MSAFDSLPLALRERCPRGLPGELREQWASLQAERLRALRERRSALPVAAEIREFYAYISRIDWEGDWEDGFRGDREPGEGMRYP